MRKTARRLLSAMMIAVMLFGMIPTIGLLSGNAHAAGNISDDFVGKDADVFSALGFDTAVLPEGYDLDSTNNPYGRDRLPGKQIFEYLLADNAGYSVLGRNNNAVTYTDIGLSSPTSRSMPLYGGKSVELMASAAGDFNGDGFNGQVAYVGITDLATAKTKTGANSVAQLVLYVFDARTGEYSATKPLGKISPYYTVKNVDFGGANMNAEADEQILYEERWQNLLQISCGDYDGDGYYEIAVYVAENYNSTTKSGARIELYKYQRTSQSKDNDWLDIGEWSRVWSHPVSVGDAHVPNMVSLNSGDFNRDGVDDLALSYGNVTYSYKNTSPALPKLVYSEPSTAIALWGSKANMLVSRSTIDTGKDHEDLGSLARVSFISGDIDQDGTPNLVMTGQLMNDLYTNKTRSVASYIYDSSSGLVIDAAATLAVVDGEFETIQVDGSSTTVWKSGNGYDQHYQSKPLMKTNSAVMTPEGDKDGCTYVYLDSVMMKYMEGSFSIAYELDDSKYDSSSGPLPGTGDGLTLPYWINASVTLTGGMYSEYGAVSGNINGKGYDILATSFFNNTNERDSTKNGYAVLSGTSEGKLTAKKMYVGVTKPVSITLPDADFDTTQIEYSGIHYLTYSDPQVLAIIAAAPYFEDVDVISDYDYAWQNTTSYSRIRGEGSSDIVSVDFSIGFYADAEIAVGGGKVELETSLGFTLNWEKETTKTTEYTLTFETSQDEDAVAFYCIPTENYVYYTYTYNADGSYVKTTDIISNTFTPAYQVLSLEYYESIQGNYDELPQIMGTAITSSPGDPGSYPRSSNGYKVIAQWNDDPAGVSFGNGAITQEITITKEESETYQLGGYWNFKAGGGGKVQSDLAQSDVDVTGGVEWSLNPAGGWSTINLEGTSFSGTVTNMPVAFQNYGYYYSWKLFAYNYVFQDGTSIPVVSYIVNDVSKPPELPKDFQQDYEKSTSTENRLTWTYEGSATKFYIYKYFDFPVGGGLEKVATIDAGESSNFMIKYDEQGKPYREYFFLDPGLSAYTEYKYAIQVERLNPVPPLSAPSGLLTVRTKARDGYPKLSISESDGNNDSNLQLYPDKNSYLTVSVTGPVGENPAVYYTVVQYQWQKLVKGVWTNMIGETNKTLTFTAAGVDSASTYRCLVNVLTKDPAMHISAYTDTVLTTHSKRPSSLSDVSVTDVAGGGLRLYAALKNLHSSESSAIPTGIVSFTLTSSLTGEQYQFYADVNAGTGMAEKVVDIELPEGLYNVEVYYSGSFIFKACSAKSMYLSQIGSGYSVDAPSSVVYGNGAYIYMQQINKALGVTNIVQIDAKDAALYQGEKLVEGKADGATKLSETNAVTAGVHYYYFDSDGIPYSFQASRTGTVEFADGYAFYLSAGARIEAAGMITQDITEAGRYILDTGTPAGNYVVLMNVESQGNNISSYALLTVSRKPITLQLPTQELMESSTLTVPQPKLGALPVLAGAWAECDIQSGALISSVADKSVPATYYNTAGQGFTEINVLKMCGYYVVAHPVSTSLASNYTITFHDGVLTVKGSAHDLEISARYFEALDVGTVYAISPKYGYTRSTTTLPSFTQQHPTGTRVVLTAVPDPGYEVYAWYVNGVKLASKANSIAHIMLNEDTKIEVQFDVKKNTISFGTLGDEGGGKLVCSDGKLTSGSVLLANSLLTFTATANPGFHFKEWRYTQVGKGSVYDTEDAGKPGSTFDFIMPTVSCSVYAVFERDFYKLTYSDLSGNNGLTAWYYKMSEDGKTPTTEKVYVQSGTMIKGDSVVTVEPAKGCKFDGDYNYVSTGSQGTADYSAGTYTLVLTKDTTITGRTDRGEYSLTLNYVVKRTSPLTPALDARIVYSTGGSDGAFVYDSGAVSTTIPGIKGGSPVTATVEVPGYYMLGGWVHEGVTTQTAVTTVDRSAIPLPANGKVVAGGTYHYNTGGTNYYFKAVASGNAEYLNDSITIHVISDSYSIAALDGDTELTIYLEEKPVYTVTMGDISGKGDYTYDLPDGHAINARQITVHEGDGLRVNVKPKSGVTVAQWTVTQDGSLPNTMYASSLSYQFQNISHNYTLEPVFASTTYNTISWPTIKKEESGIELVPEPGSMTSVSAGNNFSFKLKGEGAKLVDKVYANGYEFTATGNKLPDGTEYKVEGEVYTIYRLIANQEITLTVNTIGVTVNGVDISSFRGTGWSYAPETQTLNVTRSAVISGSNNSLAPSLCMSFGDSVGSTTFNNLTVDTAANAAIKCLNTSNITITLSGKNVIAAKNDSRYSNINGLTAVGDVTFRGNGTLDISAEGTLSTSSAEVVAISATSGKLMITGSVNITATGKAAAGSSSRATGVHADTLEIGAKDTPVSPTLRAVSTSSTGGYGVLAHTVTVFSGSLFARGGYYGISASVINNYDGLMEVSGGVSAFPRSQVTINDIFTGRVKPAYEWTAFYANGFQLRTKKVGEATYTTASKQGDSDGIELTQTTDVFFGDFWSIFFGILGYSGEGVYDYVLISPLDEVETTDMPVKVAEGSRIWQSNIPIYSAVDTFYYLSEDGTIKNTSPYFINTYVPITTTVNPVVDPALYAVGEYVADGTQNPAYGVAVAARDTAYRAFLRTLLTEAASKEALNFIAKYDSDDNELIFNRFVYNAGDLDDLGPLTELDPDNLTDLRAFIAKFMPAGGSTWSYAPHSMGDFSGASVTTSYDVTISGTIKSFSDTLDAPIVNTVSELVSSLTLDKYSSTGLVIGNIPLILNGTNYLTRADDSPLIVESDELKIFGTVAPISPPATEKDYVKDINDTLTLTTGASAGTTPAVYYGGASDELNITLTNVKALTAYAQTGAQAVSTNYTVVYTDAVLSGNDGSYGYAWLQDLGSNSATAVRQEAFNGVSDSPVHNYLRLYAATSDAGTDIAGFKYDRSVGADGSDDVLTATLYEPAVLGLIHKFAPSGGDQTSYVQLLDSSGALLGRLVYDTDYELIGPTTGITLRTTSLSFLNGLPRGKYTLKIFFHDDNEYDADLYTLSIPLDVTEVEVSSGDLEVTAASGYVRRNQSVALTTEFTGTTPSTYVWEISSHTSSGTRIDPAGAGAVLTIGADEQVAGGKITVTVKSYETADTDATPLGTASCDITVAPTAKSIAISCVGENSSESGVYMLQHNTADGIPKQWDFNALVTLDYGSPVTDVKWSLWGATMRATDVDPLTGILTIHPAETGPGSGNMRLTATYTHLDGSVFTKDVEIALSPDAFVSYVAAGTNGTITKAEYGVAQNAIAETGKWIAKGNLVTVTATPADGYIVKTWYVNGVSVMSNLKFSVDSVGNRLQFTTEQMAHYKVSADYINASSYSVTYSPAGANGSVSAVSNGANFESGARVVKGDSVTLTAVPKEFCVVARWIVNGADYEEGGALYTGTTLTLDNIDENKTVSVEFAGRSVGIAVLAAQDGGSSAPMGSVSIFLGAANITPTAADQPDLSKLYTTAAHAYDDILIFASPLPGYQVKDWSVMVSGNYVPIDNTDEEISYSVPDIINDLNLRVRFEKITEYTLTVSSDAYENGEGLVLYGHNQIAGGTSRDFNVQMHGTASLVAVPAPGSHLYRWEITGATGEEYTQYEAAGNTIFFKDIAENVSVIARFRTDHYTVELAPVTGGTFTADYSHPVDPATGTIDAGDGDELKGGSTVVLTATPGAQQKLLRLVVNGKSVTPQLDITGPLYTYTIRGLSENITASAEFAPFNYFNITAPDNYVPGGTVVIAPAADGFSRDTVPAGQTVEIASGSYAEMTFTPDVDYYVDYAKLRAGLNRVLDPGRFTTTASCQIRIENDSFVVRVNGVDTNIDFSSMESPFVAGTETRHTVTIDAVTNGALKVYYNGLELISGAQVPADAQLQVVAIPDEHYEVTSITEDGTDMGTSPGDSTLPENAYTATTTISGDITFGALFDVSEYLVTINIYGNGSGTVTAESISSTGYLPAGSEVEVTAAPAAGSALSLLIVDGTTLPSGVNTYTVDSLNSDITVSAVFLPEKCKVTFNSPANGTLVVKTMGGDIVKSGDLVDIGTYLTIFATPNPDYRLASLTGAGTPITHNTYRVDAAKNNYIEAKFELDRAYISWTNPSGGTIKVTYGDGPNNGAEIFSGQSVPMNTLVRVATTPISSDFKFTKLTINGVSVTPGQFMADRNLKIAATYQYVGNVPPSIITIVEGDTPLSGSVYFLDVSIIGNGSVKVLRDGKEIKSGDEIKLGTILTITATPANGLNLLSLKVNGVEVKSGLEYEVYANTDIIAQFDVALPYYLDLSGKRTFIGLSNDYNENGVWDSKEYIAPAGKEVLFTKNSRTFVDIPDHWALQYIEFVTSREIFQGVSATEFAPQMDLSRAMFATVIGRLYERSYGEIAASEQHAFTDCDYDSFYGKYVDWAASKGIINGYGNGKFGPDDSITREQIAVIVYNFVSALDMLPADTGPAPVFADNSQISGWARDAVKFCQSAKILQGRGDGIFAPLANATRAESATITTNLIKYIIGVHVS